eukprot:TRINITY_DN111896_c0_g1_i1.p1 TRINITY_DN111896_c0_g1~~TRINITY_DN111896_c0_g1_i1.p1  ORF type:complete len:160 (-),score=22.92 TRINITY_DN111896_c0_g1_i1:102-581(-)
MQSGTITEELECRMKDELLSACLKLRSRTKQENTHECSHRLYHARRIAETLRATSTWNRRKIAVQVPEKEERNSSGRDCPAASRIGTVAFADVEPHCEGKIQADRCTQIGESLMWFAPATSKTKKDRHQEIDKSITVCSLQHVAPFSIQKCSPGKAFVS